MARFEWWDAGLTEHALVERHRTLEILADEAHVVHANETNACAHQCRLSAKNYARARSESHDLTFAIRNGASRTALHASRARLHPLARQPRVAAHNALRRGDARRLPWYGPPNSEGAHGDNVVLRSCPGPPLERAPRDSSEACLATKRPQGLGGLRTTHEVPRELGIASAHARGMTRARVERPFIREGKRVSAYEVLELQVGCSREDAKRSYRNHVRQSHPDKGGDERLFQDVQKVRIAR